MKDREKFNYADYKTTIKDINYECHIYENEVIYSEAGDNPHGVNSESRMTLTEFLTNDNSSQARSCKNFIKQYFGEEKLERFIYFVQKQFDSLKNK